MSHGTPGTFTLSFIKEEGSQTNYNDIADENIIIVESTAQYSITFEEVDSISVGEPIEINVVLEKESSKELTLLMTENCPTEFVFSPQKIIKIPAGSKTVSFFIEYEGKVIPKMCKMEFEISSFITHNYYLPFNTLYIRSERSIQRTGSNSLMRLIISTEMKESSDVGLTVLDKPTTEIKPEIYRATPTSIEGNSASFLVSVSQDGSLYYAVVEAGTTQDSITRDEIEDESLSSGLVFG